MLPSTTDPHTAQALHRAATPRICFGLPRPLQAWPLIAMVSALLVPATALAESNPWLLGASQSLSHRSNLLSLAEGATAPAGLSASDDISSTALILGLNLPVSRQRVFTDLTLRADRYSRNSVYDNNGWSLRAGIEGTAAERVSTSLQVRSNRQLSALNTPETGLQLQKNQETNNAIDFNARLGMAGPLALLAGAGRLTIDNSADLPSVQALNLRQHYAEAGVRWQDSEALRLDLRARRVSGSLPDFGLAGDRYRRNELETSVLWQPRGRSTYEARLAWVDSAYDLVSARDFKGLTGEASWRWALGGRTRSDLRYVRTNGQNASVQTLDTALGSQELLNDYSRTNDTVRWRLDYQASAKLSLNTTLEHTRRRLYRALTLGTTLFDAEGREVTDRLAVGGSWQPLRWLQTGCSATVQRTQGRGQLGADVKGSSVSCFVQATLQ